MSTFEIICVILLVVMLAGWAATVVVLLSRRKEASDQGLQLLQQQLSSSLNQQDSRLASLSEQLSKSIQNFNTDFNERLGQNQQLTQSMQKSMAERLEFAGKTVAELKGKLGELSQATQTVVQVGSEVKKLQDILQRPGMRGGLGEWSLEGLLADVLPKQHYQLKYRFKNGREVDALVTLVEGAVAIDAKFPLANFQKMLEAENENEKAKLRRSFLRDVRMRMDEIADKYILPDEGTLDFALMYIPAENVYYEAIVTPGDKEFDVCAYGRERKVIPVSPNTLYGYLMVIATGLKGLQIEKNAQVIRAKLGQLGSDLQLYMNDFVMMGKHLANAKNKYDDGAKRLEAYQRGLQDIADQAGHDEA